MFEKLMTMLNELKEVNDVSFKVKEDGSVKVTFNDFEGFDKRWREIMRDYKKPELVDEVFDLLDACESEGDYYTTYFVEGHDVDVEFASDDI